MRTSPLVLCVGEPAEARRLRPLLCELAPGSELRLLHVDSLDAARSFDADCLVVDAGAVEEAGRTAPDVPLVALGAPGDWEAALEAIGAGAEDCVERGRVDGPGLARSVRFAIERHRAHAGLRRRALHDPLTDLPNRLLLEDRLAHGLAARGRADGSLALLFIDLDGFKAVNDRCGHAAGDAVLREVGRRLIGAVRPGDTVARLGGDEFAVLCDGVSEIEVAAIARRLGDDIALPIVVDGDTLSVGASIGIAFADDLDATPEALLGRADAAMYAVKRRPARAASRTLAQRGRRDRRALLWTGAGAVLGEPSAG